MPWHAMHPIQDLFLERFSYVLQFDMQSYVDKNFILVKSGCYTEAEEKVKQIRANILIAQSRTVTRSVAPWNLKWVTTYTFESPQ
jgi:hypothetical protein